MAKSPMSVVRPDVLKDNMESIHNFLRDSYTQAKRHLQGGISVFREELREIRDTAEACFDFFALPVNNFLKDITQIDTEFQQGLDRDPANSSRPVTPIRQALSAAGTMEENY